MTVARQAMTPVETCHLTPMRMCGALPISKATPFLALAMTGIIQIHPLTWLRSQVPAQQMRKTPRKKRKRRRKPRVPYS